jgi:hypothetical protein
MNVTSKHQISDIIYVSAKYLITFRIVDNSYACLFFYKIKQYPFIQIDRVYRYNTNSKSSKTKKKFVFNRDFTSVGPDVK